MVTTKSMRSFAADCLAWACAAEDPCQRQVMLDTARCWAVTAETIDRYVRQGKAEPLPDMRRKLN
jgi:hypothetical protein